MGRAVVQQLETDDPPSRVLHQYDLVGRLFADALLGGLVKPDGKSVSNGIVDHFDLFYIWTPALIASVG